MGRKTRGMLSGDVESTYTGITYNGAVYVHDYVSTVPYHRGYEIMVSDEPKFRRYGTCTHFCVEPALNQHPFGPWGSPDGSSHKVTNRIGFYGLLDIPMDDLEVDWDDLSAQAYQGMKPSLSAGFSLSNFLFELREIKTLFKLFNKRKSLSRNAAGAFLNYSFGWKPLLSDLKKLHDQLENWVSRYFTYMMRQNRVYTRHWSKVLVDDKQGQLLERYNAYRPVYGLRKRKAVYTATLAYTYRVKGFESKFREFKAISDSFGLKISLAKVWEAIPFSFVLDWFFNIQDWLEQFEDDYLDSQVTIVDFCHSIKVVDDLEYYAIEKWAHAPITVPLGKESRSLYKRYRAVPSTNEFGLAQSHKYGTKQILLSLALLHA